jgi:hypothetical protein
MISTHDGWAADGASAVQKCGVVAASEGRQSMTEAEWLASSDPQAMLTWLTSEGIKPVPPQPTPDGRLCTDRQLRLFGCACCRAHMDRQQASWNKSWCAELAAACEIGEQAADGLVPLPRWRGGVMAVDKASWVPHNPDARSTAFRALSLDHPQEDATLLRDIIGNPFQPVMCKNCYRGSVPTDRDDDTCPTCGGSGRLPLRWLTPTVVGIAGAIYQGRRFEDMPILADALEEAGCTDEAILRHCRGEKFLLPERCQYCNGSGIDEHRLRDSNVLYMIPPQCQHCSGGEVANTGGWRKLPGPHVRGCWTIDLILGKE